MSEFTVEVQECELVEEFVTKLGESKKRVFNWKIPIGDRSVRVVDPLIVEVNRKDGYVYITGYPMVFGFSFLFSAVLAVAFFLLYYFLGLPSWIFAFPAMFLFFSVVSNPRWFALAIWIRLRIMGYRGSYRMVHVEAVV